MNEILNELVEQGEVCLTMQLMHERSLELTDPRVTLKATTDKACSTKLMMNDFIAAVCVMLALALEVQGSSLSLKAWSFLGPFPIGKTEIDADPLDVFAHLNSTDGHPCKRESILRKTPGCPQSNFFSELVEGGVVGWSKLQSSLSDGWHHVAVQFPLSNANANFNNLVQGMNKISVLEFQGWASTAFVVKTSGRYEVQCTSIHSLYVDNVLYFADIYSQNQAGSIIHLAKGTHHLDIRIRAKGQLQFRCAVQSLAADPARALRLGDVGRGSVHTDLVEGRIPLQATSWMQLPLTNLGRDWISSLAVVITPDKAASAASPVPTAVAASASARTKSKANVFTSLAPAHTQFFPFEFELVGGSETVRWWKTPSGDDPCLSFTVHVTGLTGDGIATISNKVKVRLLCRRALQSFVFTFVDHDGSIAHAAAIKPISSATGAAPSSGYPVVLSLSGVGVSARSQADSYKYKATPRDKDYVFGMDAVWVLCPARDGAHNWEGTGFWTAIAALEYLAQATALPGNEGVTVDLGRVVLAGHSRGGHGVLTLATHMPDRFRAVVTASGYPDRESYGDANILFDVDLQLAFMDPALIAVMLGTIHEHDNLHSASNLHSMDVLVRAGAQDRTVSPYFQRQIARSLSSYRVNVTYSEKAGADHWYWDFDQPEDGGVVFDPLTRRFIQEHALRDEGRNTAPQPFQVTSWNPSTYESMHGVTVVAMASRLQRAVVKVVPGTPLLCAAHITTSNVLRLRIEPAFWAYIDGAAASTCSLTLNGQHFASLATAEPVEFCLAQQPAALPLWQVWSSITSWRHPFEYGPARQAFQAPFVLIAGTGAIALPTCGGDTLGESTESLAGGVTADDLLAAARYISMGHFAASATIAPLALDTDFSAADVQRLLDGGANVILVGGPDVNRVSRMMADMAPSFPVRFLAKGGLQMDRCLFTESSQSALFTFPLPIAPSSTLRNRIGLMITADSPSSLQDAIAFSFSCNTPLTRAPFSNMFGDYQVTGPHLRSRGLGGLQAAGFWNNEWKMAGSSSWSAVDCHA